jgi:hypothetical protein
VKRTLRLQRETLAELAADDLRAVAGASGLPCNPPDITELLGCVGTYQCPTWTC